jgi:NADP-dependent 3-hydroxy acid dehydrogenase YdfG
MKAVVVGRSSGIGEATARIFAHASAQVVIAGRDKGRLAAAVKRLGSVRGDVTDGAAFETPSAA